MSSNDNQPEQESSPRKRISKPAPRSQKIETGGGASVSDGTNSFATEGGGMSLGGTLNDQRGNMGQIGDININNSVLAGRDIRIEQRTTSTNVYSGRAKINRASFLEDIEDAVKKKDWPKVIKSAKAAKVYNVKDRRVGDYLFKAYVELGHELCLARKYEEALSNYLKRVEVW